MKVPPEKLMERVHGKSSGDINVHFNNVGSLLARQLTSHMTIEEGQSILDWGCGCGRIMSHLAPLCVGCNLYGCDCDQEAIDWCKENLSECAEFAANNPLPPLVYEDSFFDHVIGVSVFTHLPENMQLEWLKELHRVTKSGGHLYLSIHGSKFLSHLPEGEDFFYSQTTAKTEGLPEWYRASFHTERYINEVWGKYFEVEAIEREGVGGIQDLVVCKKT